MTMLKVIFGTLLLCLMLGLSFRFYGLSQVYRDYEHPLLTGVYKKNQPWLFWHNPRLDQLPTDWRNLSWGLALDLKLDANQHFNLTVPKPSGEVQDFESFLLGMPARVPILVNIMDNVVDVDLMLQALIRRTQKGAQVLIHSDYDNVTKSLRNLEPTLFFGTGIGERTRFLMLESIGLEVLPMLSGDFVYSTLKRSRISVMTQGLSREIKRRHKLLILGPLKTQEEIQAAKDLNPAGFVLDSEIPPAL